MMPWVRVDDQFPDHPKVIAAGPLAKGLFVDALCYANRLLTDGFIPRRIAIRLAAEYAEYEPPDAVIARLVAVGMWEADADQDGYRIHGYLDYQPSAEKVKAERDASARRQAEWRERNREKGGTFQRNGVTNAVTDQAEGQSTPSNAVTNGVSNAHRNGEVTSAPTPSHTQPINGASNEAPAQAPTDDKTVNGRTPGDVYALVDAFAEGKGLARGDITGKARKNAYTALADAPAWATAKEIHDCTSYLMTDPFWSEPGKLKADKVVEALAEWRNKGRPALVSRSARSGRDEPTVGLDSSKYKGDAYLRVPGR